MPLNQNKRISHRWSWDVSTIFEKSYACAFPSMMECYPALSQPVAAARLGERKIPGAERTATSTCSSRRRSKSAIVRRSPTAQRRWFCARNISSKKCNRAGPCGSSALRTRRIICRSSERRREKKFQTAKICESSVRKIVHQTIPNPQPLTKPTYAPLRIRLPQVP